VQNSETLQKQRYLIIYGAFLSGQGVDVDTLAKKVEGRLVGPLFVRPSSYGVLCGRLLQRAKQKTLLSITPSSFL
jgi:hypothetical protein